MSLLERQTESSTLLHPELIHVRKDQRALGLQRAPAIQIRHRGVVRKPHAIVLLGLRVDREANEGQAVAGQKRLDLGNRELPLLDVEEQVAASADGVKIPESGDILEGRVVVER